MNDTELYPTLNSRTSQATACYATARLGKLFRQRGNDVAAMNYCDL